MGGKKIYSHKMIGWFLVCALASKLSGRAHECFRESIVSADILYRKKPERGKNEG